MGYTIIVPYTTAAAATVANILAGTAVEYLGEAATLTVYGTGDATGDTMSLTGFRGSEPGRVVIPASSPVPVASTAGTVKTNENFIGQFPIAGNTRLVMSVTTSAAHTGRFQIVVG